MKSYKILTSPEFLDDMRSLNYINIFEIIFDADGKSVSCPSIPKDFDKEKEVSLTMSRDVVEGWCKITWKQL